jgi:hypothetical protein
MATLSSKVTPAGVASAAQGGLADTAVQPNDSPTFDGLTVEGKIASGDELNNANLSNTLNYAVAGGVTGYRAINLIDSSASIKLSRPNDNGYGAFIEFQEWDSTITTLNSRAMIVGEGGDLLYRNLTTGGGDHIFQGEANAELMRIDSAGQVGIGTNDPEYVLDIKATDNVTTTMAMSVQNSSRNYGLGIGAYSMSNRNIGGSAATVGYTFDIGGVATFKTNDVVAMTINSSQTVALSGKLTLPTATYHYSSDGKPRLYYYENGDTLFRTADDFQFRNNANATVAQIHDTGAIHTISTVTATSFIGDGSNLTGISAAVKGFITFNGSTGAVINSSNLTLSKTATGSYTIALASGIQIGSANYTVIIGNVDDKRTSDAGPASTGNNNKLSNFNAFVNTRSNASFTVNATRNVNSVVHFGGNDNNHANTFGISVVDPVEISIAVLD